MPRSGMDHGADEGPNTAHNQIGACATQASGGRLCESFCLLIRCLESLAICGFRVHCGLRQSKAKKAAVVSALRLWTAETPSPARSWMLNIKPHPRTAGKEKVCSMRGFQTFRLRCSQLLYAPTSCGCRNSGCSRMVFSGNSRTVYGLGVLFAK